MTNWQHMTKDDLDKIVVSNIKEHGWHAVDVIEDDDHPPWTYSIGLYDTWEFPELLIVGRSCATSHIILKQIVEDLDNHNTPNLKAPYDPIPGITVQFLEVRPIHYPDWVGFARWYYRKRDFPLYQIVWPDTEGHYPWDERAPTSFKEWQTLLGSSPLADSRRRC